MCQAYNNLRLLVDNLAIQSENLETAILALLDTEKTSDVMQLNFWNLSSLSFISCTDITLF